MINETKHYDFPFPGYYTFVDVEIPNINNNCICAISMIVIQDHFEVLRHTELINPKSFFSAPNMKIHGISRADVKYARTFAQFWQDYSRYFGKEYILAAHNSMSDISVINKDLSRFHTHIEATRYIDTMDIMMDFYFKGTQRKGDLRLNNIARRLGIRLDHHNPESDVNACYEIVRYMQRFHDLEIEPFIKTIPERKQRIQTTEKPTTQQMRTHLASVKRMIANKDPQVCIKRSLAASKGDKALRHGDYLKAVTYYEAAIARRFNSPGVYLHLAELYGSVNMEPEARRVLEIGISNLKRNHGNYYALRRELKRRKKSHIENPVPPKAETGSRLSQQKE